MSILGSRPPYGYKFSKDREKLVPIEKDLETLELVKNMIDDGELSYREAAFYLSKKCFRKISYEGVRKRLSRPVYLHEVEDAVQDS